MTRQVVSALRLEALRCATGEAQRRAQRQSAVRRERGAPPLRRFAGGGSEALPRYGASKSRGSRTLPADDVPTYGGSMMRPRDDGVSLRGSVTLPPYDVPVYAGSEALPRYEALYPEGASCSLRTASRFMKGALRSPHKTEHLFRGASCSLRTAAQRRRERGMPSIRCSVVPGEGSAPAGDGTM